MKKAYFKKALLMIMSLALIISTMALPASAEGASVTDEGWRFIDIAYGNGVYTAMAKNADYSSAKMYYSNDGGLTWQTSENQPLGSGAATVSINKTSQQQLVWWDAQKLFVIKGSGDPCTSPDGVTWTANHNLKCSSNAMMTTNGKYLIQAAGAFVRVTDDASELQPQFNVPSMANHYFAAVAAKPADENGKVAVFGAGQMLGTDLSFTQDSDGTCNWAEDASSSNVAIMYMRDMIYAEGADQFLFVNTDDKETLYYATSSQSVNTTVIKPGVNVTAIGASDSYIAVGMSDGTIYYTENAPITAQTQWSQIPVTMGAGTAEAVTNIEFSDDTNFVALAETEVLKGSVNGCYNINDYVEIGDIEVTGQNVFNGVRLIGGTYSPALGKYLVYGNTTSPDADGAYHGKIFVSDNGIDWRNTYTGYTFSRRMINGEGVFTGYEEVRNGAVWWEEEGIFIVSTATEDQANIAMVSEDGENWRAVWGKDNVDADGEAAPELDTCLLYTSPSPRDA